MGKFLSYKMSFSENVEHWLEAPEIARVEKMLIPCDNRQLEQMAVLSSKITRQYFGHTMRLFAPLYLSNECVNICTYCGFSRHHKINRVTLTTEQVVQEAEYLFQHGFQHILLVAGEHPGFVSLKYLQECIIQLTEKFSSLSLEIAPMDILEYRLLSDAGADGITVFQETYNKNIYTIYHKSGPKKNYSWRLDTLERAYHGGLRRLGIGVLFGLSDWREEIRFLVAHICYLQHKCWKASLTISLPRIRPSEGHFTVQNEVSDREFVQIICALRITFPHINILLSTRESPQFRDAITPLGITIMSAGSHTEPGGYTGIDSSTACSYSNKMKKGTAQFLINDHRSPIEIIKMLENIGLDPVWKDWDDALISR